MAPGSNSAFFVPLAVFSTYVHVFELHDHPVSPTEEAPSSTGLTSLNVANFGMLDSENDTGDFSPATTEP